MKKLSPKKWHKPKHNGTNNTSSVKVYIRRNTTALPTSATMTTQLGKTSVPPEARKLFLPFLSEHPTLPFSELKEISEAEGHKYRVFSTLRQVVRIEAEVEV